MKAAARSSIGPHLAAGWPAVRLREDRPEDGPLEEIRFRWGSAYDIAVTSGMYNARRRDGKGARLADALSEGLRLRIVADCERMPVHRDLP
jgi:hypothetical protein